ncbi:polysaccharide deacetylase family protein [Bhargavaea cecembensis]|uniref:polysaccharide deacetylase family protein n=1 Tax=Bhargavaea cecembensis TaxID=394098 RepID=UPI00058E01B4|nr:polysaccharide deacetylase family protein [Bhargavaea cecembensis]
MRGLMPWIISLALLMLAGCSPFVKEAVEPKVKGSASEMKIPEFSVPEQEPIASIVTTEKAMALTFNGLAEASTMHGVLDALDEVGVKATFFVPGIRVAEQPELAREIMDRGHELANNTLNQVMPNSLSYKEAYMEINLANEVLKQTVKIEPRYVRSRSGDSGVSFEQAASQIGMQVVTNTINPKDSDMKSAEEIAAYVKRFSTRGAIIQLNTDVNPAVVDAIPLIYEEAATSGYEFMTLDEIAATSYADEEYTSNGLKENLDYKKLQPKIIERFSTSKKEIALTFDDWASDKTISKVLEILKLQNVKATFFLKADGVEANPQLARLILEDGHEIANHSYSHLDLTTMTPEEIQEDLIKADEVISQAIRKTPSNYFRPAKGIIDEERAKIVAATGIEATILTGVSSLDWNMWFTDQEIYERVMERVEPGSIITMHILDESHTIKVLPRLLKDLREKGYEFRTVDSFMKDRQVTAVEKRADGR